jgi:hypothetical protein
VNTSTLIVLRFCFLATYLDFLAETSSFTSVLWSFSAERRYDCFEWLERIEEKTIFYFSTSSLNSTLIDTVCVMQSCIYRRYTGPKIKRFHYRELLFTLLDTSYYSAKCKLDKGVSLNSFVRSSII